MATLTDRIWKLTGEACGVTIILNALAWVAYSLIHFISWCAQMSGGDLAMLRTFVLRFNLTLLPVAFLMAIQAWRHYHERRKA